MRTIDKYPNQNDELFHPLWLGILILFGVMIIIGIVCCLRIKCGLQFRHFLQRLFGRNSKNNENNSTEDKNLTMRSSYNWSSNYNPTKSPSPKLYALIQNIREANLEKQVSIQQKSDNEDENAREILSAADYDQSPISVITPIIDSSRTSEIARKFYASMRNNSQYPNSPSLDSSNTDASLSTDPRLSIIDQPDRDEHTNSFLTPRFFQSIPITDGLGIVL